MYIRWRLLLSESHYFFGRGGERVGGGNYMYYRVPSSSLLGVLHVDPGQTSNFTCAKLNSVNYM